MTRRLLAALDRHWFAPAPMSDLGFVRAVVFGTQLLLFGAPLWLTQRTAQMDGALYQPIPALKVLLLPLGWGARPELGLLLAAHAVAIGAGLLATLGLWTRWTTLLATAANTLLIAHYESYGELHHGEALTILACWTLVLAPSGAAFSLDSWRRRAGMAPEPELGMDARWPLRIVQWLFVIVYGSAGLAKLAHGGLDWANGYTLAYYSMVDGLRMKSHLGLLLAGLPDLARLLSIGALLFELTFVMTILMPRVAWLYLLAGLVMHTMIYYIQRAPFFNFCVLYVVFLEALRRYGPFARRRAVAEPHPSADERAAAAPAAA